MTKYSFDVIFNDLQAIASYEVKEEEEETDTNLVKFIEILYESDSLSDGFRNTIKNRKMMTSTSLYSNKQIIVKIIR